MKNLEKYSVAELKALDKYELAYLYLNSVPGVFNGSFKSELVLDRCVKEGIEDKYVDAFILKALKHDELNWPVTEIKRDW